MDYLDGCTQEQLQQLGARQMKNALPMSAADIDAQIPFAVSQEMQKHFNGYSNEDLKRVGERKMQLPAMLTPEHINYQPQTSNDAVENVLNKLQRYLGIKT